MTNYTLGYARVSTDPQSLDQQLDALVVAGIAEDRIYTDKMSGARTDRPGLEELLDAAREGDTIVVVERCCPPHRTQTAPKVFGVPL